MDLINCTKQHYRINWHDFTEHRFDKGPIDELPEDFCILKFQPNEKRGMWAYATCGMSRGVSQQILELHIFSQNENDFLIELLTHLSPEN